MLREPEISIVSKWLAAGGEIKRIPCGVSGGTHWQSQMCRRVGVAGHVKRHGARYVEQEAIPFIAGGEITMAQARVAAVWGMLHKCGPMNEHRLSLALDLNHDACGKVIDALIAAGAAEDVLETGLVRAIGDAAPNWRDFLEQRRAA